MNTTPTTTSVDTSKAFQTSREMDYVEQNIAYMVSTIVHEYDELIAHLKGTHERATLQLQEIARKEAEARNELQVLENEFEKEVELEEQVSN